MKNALLIAVLGGMSVVACAQSKAPAETAKPADAPAATTAPTDPKVAPGSADAKAIAAIRQLSSQVVIDKVGPAPMPGYREVVVSGQVLYVSDDGRYLMQGALLDMQTKRDMAQATLASVRKDLLAQVPKSERIIFSPPNPKYTVAIFTDVECGYCRKMHADIAEYNKLGIGFEYLAYPRMGPGSPDFAKMEAVWCAKDRPKALTEAKGDDQVGAVIENLRKVPKNRPQKERTLRATVANWFGNKLDDAAVDRIIGELVKRKVIAVDQGKVRYSLPH